MAKLNSRTCWAPAIACCLALATVCGCRNLDNAQVDVLEREMRQQEDYIYELEDYLISYSEKLRQCRMAANCQPTAASSSSKKKPTPGEPQLMEDLPRPASKPAGGKPVAPATEPPPTEPAVEPAVPKSFDPKKLEIPEIEFGPGASSLKWKTRDAVAAAPPAAAEAPVEEGPLYIPDPVDYQADAAPPVEEASAPLAEAAGPALGDPAAEADRLTAQRLEIRRVFGEPSTDEPAKLDRLLVVVEALSSADEPVDASGEASLMVMTRDEAGELTPVERWDFNSEETAAAWQSSRLGDGLHFELPLEGRELPAGNLELWARVVNADGGKLLASLPLEPTQLASVEDAPSEGPIAAAAPLPHISQAAAPTTSPAASPAIATTQWRASTERLGRDRVEGFASTAAGKPRWKSQSPASQVTRVAAATPDAPAQSNSPPAEASSPQRQWKPFR